MSSVLEDRPHAGTLATPPAEERAQTDGFHLVIDALKLNGIDTIFGLPGIPKIGRAHV